MTHSAPLLDTDQLARLLGVSVDYVQRQCARRRWPHRRIGRRIGFTPADVDSILALGRVEPLPESRPVTEAARPRRRYPTMPHRDAS